MRRITVVGGSLAGLRAATSLRREGFDGDITIVSAEDHLPVDRPPLSKQVLAGTWEPEKAALRGVDEASADWLLGRSAIALDVASHAVTLDDGSVLDADGVVIATGAAPRRLPFAPLDGVFELRTVDDCLALRAALATSARLVAIGAGFIGSEVAATARGLGLDVTIIEMLPIPLERALGASLGGRVARLHRDNGVDLRLGVGLSGFLGSGHVGGVELADGTKIEADTVVVGVGVAPVTDWLSSSGLTLNDGVVCDERCQAAPGIVAAGDVARWYHPRYGTHMRVEHWTNASEQAAAAAATLLHGTAAPSYQPVPYFWSDQHGTKIQFIGASGEDVEVVEGDLDDDRFVATYATDGAIKGVLLWNRPARLPHWMDELTSSA